VANALWGFNRGKYNEKKGRNVGHKDFRTELYELAYEILWTPIIKAALPRKIQLCGSSLRDKLLKRIQDENKNIEVKTHCHPSTWVY